MCEMVLIKAAKCDGFGYRGTLNLNVRSRFGAFVDIWLINLDESYGRSLNCAIFYKMVACWFSSVLTSLRYIQAAFASQI